ncbi:MAG: type II secretion system GspH family protein [Puniceicoccales bacterium]|jgi:type II secretory pathway pseudopilin PulG|nr:type II secretion system GspH family protein [Puniceicoccales bacterium]
MFILQSDKATKRQSVKSKNKSFTLVEIVFTIVIIGILLAIFLPVMSSIKLSAQKLKDASNLKAIAAAWREAVINRGRIIDGKDDNRYWVTVFAEQLAGRGKGNLSDIILNNSHVYISPGDKYASQIYNEAIAYFNGNAIACTGAFAGTSNFMAVSVTCAERISYCFILNLPGSVPLATTPLGFTRGLRADGKWDEKAGLYGSKGGYVIYCDGHTVWFDGSKSAKFLHWNGQEYTSDIRQAVPSSTFITCGNPGTKTDYKSDGKSADQLVILYHAGIGGD